jgi:hypothetical protein
MSGNSVLIVIKATNLVIVLKNELNREFDTKWRIATDQCKFTRGM